MSIKRRDKEDNVYSRLQQQSLELLQELSGKRWTDFNEHDPGVTIMDILNYNLLELHYQTAFDFEKYLTPFSKDELKFSRMGLLPGSEIFSPCIVSSRDYEELIESCVKGVKACKVKIQAGNLYQISIAIEDEKQAGELIPEVESLYHQYRNLCENLDEVVVEKISEKKRFRQSGSVDYFQKNEKIQAQNAFTAPHVSVQYDFPDTYGINRQGLSSSVSEERQAQALQLKAYLLVFDYLLSATKQQLGNLHQTLALSGQTAPPFSPQIEADDMRLLVDSEKQEQTELFKKEEEDKQKSAYLDMLDALYGEDTGFISKNKQLSPEEVNRERAKLIRRLPTLNTERFRAINLKDESLQSMPGIKKLIQAFLGNKQPYGMTLESLFARYKFRLINDNALYANESVFSELPYRTTDYGMDSFTGKTEPIPAVRLLPEHKKYSLLKKRLHFFSRNLLLESLLTHGTQPKNYRIKRTGFEDNAILLYKQPSGNQWLNMGFFDHTETLIQTANLLWDFLNMLNKRCTMFYLVENLLLHPPSRISADEYNILYLVFPAWRESFYQEHNYLEHLRQRLPVHIEARVIWLSFDEFYRFERHYFSWRKAMANNDNENQELYAGKIKGTVNLEMKDEE